MHRIKTFRFLRKHANNVLNKSFNYYKHINLYDETMVFNYQQMSIYEFLIWLQIRFLLSFSYLKINGTKCKYFLLRIANFLLYYVITVENFSVQIPPNYKMYRIPCCQIAH